MKKLDLNLLVSTLFTFLAFSIQAQNVGINSTGIAPNASAGLDVNFSDKGLLIPRVSLTSATDVSTIPSPATSLLIYNTSTAGTAPNTVTPGYYYWTGTAWTRLAAGNASQWNTSGNDLNYTTGSVNIGTSTSDASAILNASSANKGVLIPQIALTGTTSALPVTSPTTSLLVYNTATAGTSPNNVTPGYYYWTGAAWTRLADDNVTVSGWGTIGNSGTTSTNFLGTTDNQPLRFRTNNTQAMIVDATGNIGIGSSPTFTSSPNAEKLLVDAGTTGSYNVISGKGTINNYLQLNIQNRSTGASASSDVVASNDAGNESVNFVDLGINSSGNTSTGILGGANTGYLYSTGSDFSIGNATSNNNLKFFTGGTGTGNERLRITSIGNVGVGVTDPANNLVVKDTLEIRRTGSNMSLLTFSNTAGTGNFRIAGDGSDLFWQGGGGKSLQMGSYHTTIIGGDRQINSYPAFADPIANVGVMIPAQRDVSKALVIRGNSGTQTANLTEWQSSSGTNLLSVSPLGNLGIGTDAGADGKLMIDAGTDPVSQTLINAEGSLNDYLQLNIKNNSNGSNASTDIIATANNGSETSAYIDMGINSQGYATSTTRILNGANTAYLYSNAGKMMIGNAAQGQYLGFFTNSTGSSGDDATGTERMRIQADGEILIGTTTDGGAYRLQVAGNSLVQSLIPSVDATYDLGASNRRWSTLYYQTATQSSDRRLKTNISELKYGLSDVLKMHPVIYNWKSNPDTNKQVGLIAQELRAIVPEVVQGDESKENLGVNYTSLIPVLINAIKEQQAQIKAQQGQIDNQNTKIEALNKEVQYFKTSTSKIASQNK